MKKLTRTTARLLSVLLLLCWLSGCQTVQPSQSSQQTSTEGEESQTAGAEAEQESTVSAEKVSSSAATPSPTAAEMFTNRDRETDYDPNKAVTIALNGDSATASADGVMISGSTVQITQAATYVLSGTLTNGQILINVDETEKVQLVLNGVHITSQSSAALYIRSGDKVFVTLAAGTTNTLENGGVFKPIDDNHIDGTVFSKQDLTFNGTGSLTVTAPAGHGIVCKDDLVFTGGTYTLQAASHGVDANDSVRITEATLYMDVGKDMVHVENTEDTAKGFFYMESGTLQGEAEGDGVDASGFIQIEGGTVELLVGGGAENGTKASSGQYGSFMGGGPGGRSGGFGGGMRPGESFSEYGSTADTATEDVVSMKGLKATQGLVLSGGQFTINAADDCIHADTTAAIHGGTFCLASGDDAIHADEALTVTGGKLEITECYEGLEALHLEISGGEIRLVATDDGLNAAGGKDESGITGGRDGMFGGPGGMSASDGTIVISGGTLYIRASGDGIDANGSVEITGGYTVVCGPTQGDTSTLDYDTRATITGGTFIGTGAAGMAQTFSDSEQGVIALRVDQQTAGTSITVQDTAGNVLMEHTPELDFAVVILSDPAMRSGEDYIVSVGSQTGTFTAA